MQAERINELKSTVAWFDGFTKVVLAIMFVILTFIFVSSKYMGSQHMEGGGTDDTVNSMASKITGEEAHPFVDLPGDAQVGAFSIANLGVGLIVGHLWSKLFGEKARKD